MRVIIVGAGGHGEVMADALLQSGLEGVEPLGYVDDQPALVGCRRQGLPVLGTIASLPDIPHEAVIIAIGDNARRAALFGRLTKAGERFATIRHPSAIIAPDVTIGAGTVICAGVIVNPGAVIGANVILNTGCSVDHHNRIGDHSHVAPGARLGGEVSIGEGTLVGIGATVMPGRQTGPWSAVGAGALVHKNVPSRVTVVGVPATPLRRGCQPAHQHEGVLS